MSDSDESEAGSREINRAEGEFSETESENEIYPRLRSKVWKYFQEISRDQAKCLNCHGDPLSTPGGLTTTLHRHLKSCYKISKGKCSIL